MGNLAGSGTAYFRAGSSKKAGHTHTQCLGPCPSSHASGRPTHAPSKGCRSAAIMVICRTRFAKNVTFIYGFKGTSWIMGVICLCGCSHPKSLKQINPTCCTIDRRPPFSLFRLQNAAHFPGASSRVERPVERNDPFGGNLPKHPATSAPSCKRWVGASHLHPLLCNCVETSHFPEQVLVLKGVENGCREKLVSNCSKFKRQLI